MKQTFYAAMLCILTILYSCNDKVTTESLTSGVWSVSEITKNGTQKKCSTSDCLLKFKYDNTVTATFNEVNYNGVWSTNTGDYTDDEPVKNNFSIDFPNQVISFHFNGSYRTPGQSKDKIILEGENTDSISLNLLLTKIKPDKSHSRCKN